MASSASKSSFTESLLSGDEEEGIKTRTGSIELPSKWTFLHATYHCIVTILGTGILGFPEATAILGYTASVIFIIVITAASYYTSWILVDVQEVGQTNFSDIADGLFGEGWSKWRVKPLIFISFFPTVAIMILIGGDALHSIAQMGRNDGLVSKAIWGWIMGAFVFSVSLIPDLSQAWPVSVVGSIAAFMLVGYAIAGSAIWLEQCTPSNENFASHDDVTSQVFSAFTAMGAILFGYGFQPVLPDIQASMDIKDRKERSKQMMRAVNWSFGLVCPSYLVVAVLGYAAFGKEVDGNVMNSAAAIIPDAAMIVMFVFIIFKTASEAAAYNQASFTLLRECLGFSNAEHTTKSRAFEFTTRFFWSLTATLVAIYLPYFGDLSSITMALSSPIVFIIPILMWNKKYGETAPGWRLRAHWCFNAIFGVLLSVLAFVGSIGDMAIEMTSTSSSNQNSLVCIPK